MHKVIRFSLFFLFFNLMTQEIKTFEDRKFSFRSSDGVKISVSPSIVSNVKAFRDFLEIDTFDDESLEEVNLPLVSQEAWQMIVTLIEKLKSKEQDFYDQIAHNYRYDEFVNYEKELPYYVKNVVKNTIKNCKFDQLMEILKAVDFLQPSITFLKDDKEITCYFFDIIMEKLSYQIKELPLSKGFECLSKIDHNTIAYKLKESLLKDLFKFECGALKYYRYKEAHAIEDEVWEQNFNNVDFLLNDNQRWVEYLKGSSTIFFKNSLGEQEFSIKVPNKVKLGAVFYVEKNCLFYINIANKKVSLNRIKFNEVGSIVEQSVISNEYVGVLSSYASHKDRKKYAFTVQSRTKDHLIFFDFEQRNQEQVANKVLSFNQGNLSSIGFNKLGDKIIFSCGNKKACLYSINESFDFQDETSMLLLPLIDINCNSSINALAISEDDCFLAVCTGKTVEKLSFFDIVRRQFVSSKSFEIGSNLRVEKINFTDKCCKVFLYNGLIKYYLTPKLIEEVMQKNFSLDDALFVYTLKHKNNNTTEREKVKQFYHFYMTHQEDDVVVITSQYEDYKAALKDYNGVHLLKPQDQVREERIALFQGLEQNYIKAQERRKAAKVAAKSALSRKTSALEDKEDEENFFRKRKRSLLSLNQSNQEVLND